MRKSYSKRGYLYISILMILMLFCVFNATAGGSVNLNVKDGSDITVTLQNALDKNRYNSEEKLTITIPKGTYHISKPLNLYSNTTINMSGVIIKRSGAMSDDVSMMRLARKAEIDGHDDMYNKYTSFHDISFNGGTFDDCGAKTGIIKLCNIQNVTFNGVSFKNYAQAHCIEIAAANKVTIKKCNFSGYKGSINSKNNCEAIQIDISRYSTFKDFGNTDLPCKNITILSCTFDKVHRGVGTHNGIRGVYHSNIRIINNTFKDVYGYAITCLNYVNSEISGNKIQNCGSGIRFLAITINNTSANYFTPLKSGPKVLTNLNTAIKDNQISVINRNYDATNFGIYAFGRSISENEAKGAFAKGKYYVSGVDISNNTISLNTTGYGIWLKGGQNNKIDGNIVKLNVSKLGTSSASDGIKLDGSFDNTVSNNSVSDLSKSNPVATSSLIILMDDSKNNVISKNTLTGAKRDGIMVYYSPSNIIKSNTIKSNGRRGICVEASKSTQLISNKLSGFGKDSDALTLNSSDNSIITSNSVTNANRDGLFIKDSKNLQVNKNKVKGAKRDGIYLSNISSSSAEENVITNPSRRGITLDSCKSVKVIANNINGGDNDCNGVIEYKSSSITQKNNISQGAKTSHDYVIKGSRATLEKDGHIDASCKKCKTGTFSIDIPHINKVYFSYKKYSYTGSEVKPKLKVYDANGKSVSDSNYTVKYSNNINIGMASATVTFKGFYSGKTSVGFEIAPGKVTDLKIDKVKTKSIDLSWKKSLGSKYFKVEWSKNNKDWTSLGFTSNQYISVSGLSDGTKYYFRVTSYSADKKHYSLSKATVKSQTLCSAPSIKLSSKSSKSAVVEITEVKGAKEYAIYLSSDNQSFEKIGTTDSTKYTIKGLNPGKKVYVKLRAVNSYGKYSAYSTVESVTVKK